MFGGRWCFCVGFGSILLEFLLFGVSAVVWFLDLRLMMLMMLSFSGLGVLSSSKGECGRGWFCCVTWCVWVVGLCYSGVVGVLVAVRIALGSLDLDSCGVIRYKFPV